MTDPLSITASLVSVTAVGVHVIVLVEGFISDYRNAPAEVSLLTAELQALCKLLGRITEFSRRPGLELLLPEQLIEDLRPVLGSCMLLFERTERVMGKLSKGMLAGSVLAKMRWVVKEKEVEKLRLAMAEHKLTLNMTLSVASWWVQHIEIHMGHCYTLLTEELYDKA